MSIKFGKVDKEFQDKHLISLLKNILMKHFFNKKINEDTLSVIVKVFAEAIESYLKQNKKHIPFKVRADFDENLDVVIDILKK